MESKTYRWLEFLIIFVILPVSFALEYPPVIKLFLGSMGFLYVIYLLLKVEDVRFQLSPTINWKTFWKLTFAKFLIIAILTTSFVYFTDKGNLFCVLLSKPKMWVLILFMYALFSVYPQELIYRTLYFNRYQNLMKSKWISIILNALVFSMAHLMFKNTLVLIMTFLGGLLFALTFLKTKSTTLVSIEHAIYGSWLFTVGMGDMLGFPS